MMLQPYKDKLSFALPYVLAAMFVCVFVFLMFPQFWPRFIPEELVIVIAVGYYVVESIFCKSARKTSSKPKIRIDVKLMCVIASILVTALVLYKTRRFGLLSFPVGLGAFIAFWLFIRSILTGVKND